MCSTNQSVGRYPKLYTERKCKQWRGHFYELDTINIHEMPFLMTLQRTNFHIHMGKEQKMVKFDLCFTYCNKAFNGKFFKNHHAFF